VLIGRANASEPNMGLQVWPKAEIRQADALVAKNYLTDTEVRELNRLTTILLDIFEDQLDIGRLTTMGEATRLLESQLRHLNRMVLTHGGQISHHRAEARAKTEYQKFDERRKALKAAEFARELAELKNAERSLPKTKPRKPSKLNPNAT
jgi:hypothetical protein